MKKQTFTLLFLTILFQCKEELPVPQSFPIVTTTGAISDEQGITFEGKLLNDGGYEILSYGFVYSSYVSFYDPGPSIGAIVYEPGDPGDKIFALKTISVGNAPIYEYRSFVTYVENSVKRTSYGNVLSIDSKVQSHPTGWNLIAANETLRGDGEGLTVTASYREGSILEAYFIQQDGKVTKFNVDERVISAGPNFPLNANQAALKLYSAMPFVLNSQNNNVYTLQANSWAIRTQLPFNHENLAAGDVYVNLYYPHVYIFGSFGTYLYNYRDDEWETRATLPLSAGQSIVAGANQYDKHYILTNDGSIRRFYGNSVNLLTTFPGEINGRVVMFLSDQNLYVGLNNLSDQKLWQFNLVEARWSEAASFPEPLDHPIYFSVSGVFYLANKKTNGNYDIWDFHQEY